MPKRNLYVATTDHGFGHTTRTAAVVAEIQALAPEIGIIMVTTAPQWLLRQYLTNDFIHRKCALDVGVIQSDSLTVDKRATLQQLIELRSQEEAIVAKEVEFIGNHQVDLVLGDIPPLSVKIAHEAGIPCWMTSNFGWDFIYRDWGSQFNDMSDWITQLYRNCDHLLRIPFHEPMKAFSKVTDVGLTGGVPRHSSDALKARFEINETAKQRVLLTFGGGGVNQIPYQNLHSFPETQFITFDQDAPSISNLLKITDTQYKPVDFMPLCNCVISKPGYSTFAEVSRLNIPVVSITREDFAESRPLLEGIKSQVPHRILEPDEFFRGNWQFLNKPLTQPTQPHNLSTEGNKEVARAVVNYFSGLPE